MTDLAFIPVTNLFSKLTLGSQTLSILHSQTLLLIILTSLSLLLVLLYAESSFFIHYLEQNFGNGEIILDLIYSAFISFSDLFGKSMLDSEIQSILDL